MKQLKMMENMKYKIGDKVRIKNIDWYNTNKDEDGIVELSTHVFTPGMPQFCGRVMTISHVGIDYYTMVEDLVGYWTDEMIEGLVEEETKPESKFYIGDVVYSTTWQRYVVITKILPDGFYEVGEYGTGRFKEHEDNLLETKFGTASKLIEIKSNANCLTRERVDELATKIYKDLPSGNQNVLELPDGYIFKDENGNVINAQKILLEKKKNEYPKTYEECCRVLGVSEFEYNHTGTNVWYRHKLMATLDKLMLCRDAYWKVAGDELGLGKPWEPDYDSGVNKYGIIYMNGVVQKSNPTTNWERHLNKVFDFPTPEMRDAFYENFKEEIESCKELL